MKIADERVAFGVAVMDSDALMIGRARPLRQFQQSRQSNNNSRASNKNSNNSNNNNNKKKYIYKNLRAKLGKFGGDDVSASLEAAHLAAGLEGGAVGALLVVRGVRR